MLPEVTTESKSLKRCINFHDFFFPLEQIMAEDQEYGALVPICDVFQEEVPLDPASGTRRYGAWGGPERWKGSSLSQVNGLCWPELLLTDA